MSTATEVATHPTAASNRSTAEAVARARRGPRRRRRVVLGVLVLLLVGLVLVRALLGDYRVSLPDAVRILGGTDIPGASFVLMESTLPRAVMGHEFLDPGDFKERGVARLEALVVAEEKSVWALQGAPDKAALDQQVIDDRALLSRTKARDWDRR